MPLSTDFLLLFDEAPGTPVTTSGGMQAEVAQSGVTTSTSGSRGAAVQGAQFSGTSTFSIQAQGTTQAVSTTSGATSSANRSTGSTLAHPVLSGASATAGRATGDVAFATATGGETQGATSSTGDVFPDAPPIAGSTSSAPPVTTTGAEQPAPPNIAGSTTTTTSTFGGMAVTAEMGGVTSTESVAPEPLPVTPVVVGPSGGIGQIVQIRPKAPVGTAGGMTAVLGPLTGETRIEASSAGGLAVWTMIQGASHAQSVTSGSTAIGVVMDGETHIRWSDPPVALWLLGIDVEDEELVLV